MKRESQEECIESLESWSFKSTLNGLTMILLSIAYSANNEVPSWLPELIASLIKTKVFLSKMSTWYKAPCIAIVGNLKEEIDKYIQWFWKVHETTWKKKKDEWFTHD